MLERLVFLLALEGGQHDVDDRGAPGVEQRRPEDERGADEGRVLEGVHEPVGPTEDLARGLARPRWGGGTSGGTAVQQRRPPCRCESR